MTDAFDAAAFQAETGVSRETIARFERWRDMLAETNAHTNLVGRSTLDDFWFRHALDSWQVYQQAPQAARWADLGAGAGFPGLAIAYGLMQAGTPGGHVTLVESVQKKAQFLKAVAAATGAPVTVLPIRVEALDEVPVVDVVTARAMAPLETMMTSRPSAARAAIWRHQVPIASASTPLPSLVTRLEPTFTTMRRAC